MPQYELQNAAGELLLIGDAPSKLDAELYGYRQVPGFHQAVEVGQYGTQAHALKQLDEALAQLGVTSDPRRRAPLTVRCASVYG